MNTDTIKRYLSWVIAAALFMEQLDATIVNMAVPAMMMSVWRLSIIRTFPKSELLRAMNFVIIPALIGPLLGPTVGGLIVHWFSWRYIFFINVPVGLLALLLGHRFMPDYRSDTPRPLFDAASAAGRRVRCAARRLK